MQKEDHGVIKENVESCQEDITASEELLQVKHIQLKNICIATGIKWPESRNIAAPINSPGGGIGRRSRLKICRSQECAGSIPVLGTD